MRKLLIIIMLAPSYLFGQNEISDYKSDVKRFYQILYSKDPDSIAFTKLYGPVTPMGCHQFLSLCKLRIESNDTLNIANYKKMKENPTQLTCYFQITQGLPLQKLLKLIDNAVLYEDDNPFLVCIDLNFSNKKCVHFVITTETPSQIFYIYLNNGDNLEDLLLNEKAEKLYRVGIINNPNGFVYVKAKPHYKSMVVDKFLKNKVFFYTPIGDSNWWPVVTSKTIKQLSIGGYIYKDEILSFKDFPKWLKEKMIKQYLNSENVEPGKFNSTCLQRFDLAWQNIQ